jgi:hypothetical protein
MESIKLAEAVERAAECRAPAKTWQVPESAELRFGNGHNPFDGMTVTHWSVD